MTKSATSSRQSRGLVADINHESPRHKSRRRLLLFVSRTFVLCVRDKVADFVAAFSPALQRVKFHWSDTNGFVADMLQTLSQTSRHVQMVNFCVRDFRDLCPRLSALGSFGESPRNGILGIELYKKAK